MLPQNGYHWLQYFDNSRLPNLATLERCRGHCGVNQPKMTTSGYGQVAICFVQVLSNLVER
jgi:hypothetical protein